MFLEQKLFYKSFDPGAAYTYGRLSQWLIPGKYGIQTSGASTTVSATNGSPFSPVTVGSRIVPYTPPDIPGPGTSVERTVTAKASDTSITVDSAITLAAGTNWGFYHFKSGTTDADGWHNVANLSAITVYVDLEALAGTSVDVQIQAGGGQYSVPVTISTTNIAAAGETSISITQVVQSLRIGVKDNGGGANPVTIWLVGEHLLAR
jgi:hypothetical protein